MIVVKFGGTSVADAEAIERAADIVNQAITTSRIRRCVGVAVMEANGPLGEPSSRPAQQD